MARKLEIAKPFDSADYLETHDVVYTGGPLVLDDGTKVDLNRPSPFDPEHTLYRRPRLQIHGDATAEQVQEAAVWHTEQHPRWPKGMGHRAGEFMRVGEHFMSGGKEWEIANIVHGHVIAHVAGGHKGQVQTKAFEVKQTAQGAHVPEVEKWVQAPIPTGGKHPGGTVTLVDPYVHPETHDPSIPIPADSPISAEEWQRFGRLDQLVYTELQERFGAYKDSSQTQAVIDGAYGAFSAKAKQLVTGAFQSQYGQSSGKTLPLAEGQIHGVSPAEREEAQALLGELAAAVQWDLYNRTHAPDVTVSHKSTDSKQWWQKKITEKEPIFASLSQAWSYKPDGFGSNGMITPLAIRHIAMSTWSAKVSSSASTYYGEKEVGTPYRWIATDRSVAISDGDPSQNKALTWLQGASNAVPVGGNVAEAFADSIKNGTYLAPVPQPLQITMDGANGKTWVDPPPGIADPFPGAELPQGYEKVIAPPDMPKGLPYLKVDAEGHPVATTGEEVTAHVGQYFFGLKGTLYWVGPDPGAKGGYPFHIFKLQNGQVTSEDFAYNATLPGYYLDKTFNIGDWLEKQMKAPGFHPEDWQQGAEPKYIEQFQPGEKFTHAGTAYEVIGAAQGGQVPVIDMESGLKGKANAAAKQVPLVPYDGTAKPLAEPTVDKYEAGDWVATPFGKAQVTGVAEPPREGGAPSVGQLVTVKHVAKEPGTAPESELSAKELHHWLPSTSVTPPVGTTVAHDGKKAVVTKVLKSTGEIQLNLQPGKVKLTPEEWAAQHWAHALDPNAYSIDTAKTKLRDMQVGDLFHVGKGSETKRPYQVVYKAEGDKQVWVQNLDTGKVEAMSRNVGYRMMRPLADAQQPSVDEPKATPAEPTGAGRVGVPWDPAKFELTGEKWSLQNILPGTYFQGGNGATLQKSSESPDAQMATVLNLQTGKTMTVEQLTEPWVAMQFETYKPVGLPPTQASAPEAGATPAEPDYSAWREGEKTTTGEAPVGSVFRFTSGVVARKYGTTDAGGVQLEKLTGAAKGIKYEGAGIAPVVLLTPPPGSEGSGGAPSGWVAGPSMTIFDMPVGTHYMTDEGAVIQVLDKQGSTFELKMVKSPNLPDSIKQGVTWKANLTTSVPKVTVTPVEADPAVPGEGQHDPMSGSFDPSAYLEGEKQKIGEMAPGSIFKTEGKKGTTYYQVSQDGTHVTNVLTGKVYVLKPKWLGTALLPTATPPPTFDAATWQDGPERVLADIPEGGYFVYGEHTWQKLADGKVQRVWHNGNGEPPNAAVPKGPVWPSAKLLVTKVPPSPDALPSPDAASAPPSAPVDTEGVALNAGDKVVAPSGIKGTVEKISGSGLVHVTPAPNEPGSVPALLFSPHELTHDPLAATPPPGEFDPSRFTEGPKLPLAQIPDGSYFKGAAALYVWQKHGDKAKMVYSLSTSKPYPANAALHDESSMSLQGPLQTLVPLGGAAGPAAARYHVGQVVAYAQPNGHTATGWIEEDVSTSATQHAYLINDEHVDERSIAGAMPSTEAGYPPGGQAKAVGNLEKGELFRPGGGGLTAVGEVGIVMGKTPGGGVEVATLTPGGVSGGATLDPAALVHQLSVNTPGEPTPEARAAEHTVAPSPEGRVGSLKVGETFKVPSGYTGEGITMVVTSTELTHHPAVSHLGEYWTLKTKPVAHPDGTPYPETVPAQETSAALPLAPVGPPADVPQDGTVLRPKATNPASYDLLEQGDVAQMQDLKVGDQFHIDGLIPTYQVTKVPDPSGSPEDSYGAAAEVSADGLGEKLKMTPTAAVKLYAKRGDLKPSSGVPPMFFEWLPDAQRQGQLSGFATAANGPVTNVPVGLLPNSATFQDAHGKIWQVKRPGASPIVSNGTYNYKVTDPSVLVADTQQAAFGSLFSGAGDFVDLAPPIPTEDHPIGYQQVKGTLVANEGLKQLGELSLHPGDHLQLGSQVYEIQAPDNQWVKLKNIETGKQKYVGQQNIPVAMQPMLAVGTSGGPDEAAPPPSLYTEATQYGDLPKGARYTVAPESTNVWIKGAQGNYDELIAAGTTTPSAHPLAVVYAQPGAAAAPKPLAVGDLTTYGELPYGTRWAFASGGLQGQTEWVKTRDGDVLVGGVSPPGSPEAPGTAVVVTKLPVGEQPVSATGGESAPKLPKFSELTAQAKYGDLPYNTPFGFPATPSVWIKREDGDHQVKPTGEVSLTPTGKEPPGKMVPVLPKDVPRAAAEPESLSGEFVVPVKVLVTPTTKQATGVPDWAPTGVDAPSAYTAGVPYNQLPVGTKYKPSEQSGTITVKTPGPPDAPGAMAWVKPEDVPGAPPPPTPEGFSPVGPLPSVGGVVHEHPLPGYSQATYGPFKQEPLNVLQPGQLFRDKEGTDYRVLAQAPPLRTIYERLPDGAQFESQGSIRVRLTAPPPDPGPGLAPLIHDLIRQYGSLDNVPSEVYTSHAGTVSGGGKQKHPMLAYLTQGQSFVDGGGEKGQFLAAWADKALVMNAKGEIRVTPSRTRVQPL